MSTSTYSINNATSDSIESAITSRCKAASDLLRLTVLHLLRDNSFGVTELCQILAHKQSGLSHHLKVLAQSGLVTTRREGNSIFYQRAPLPVNATLEKLQSSLYTAADEIQLSPSSSARLIEVQQSRARLRRIQRWCNS